jgi:hypothetical protein
MEHMISSPHNIPPIHSELDFTIIEIDGASFTRETPPLLVDMQPGALVTAGTHRFRAKVMPHLRRVDDQPHDVSFVAAVESGKAYFLVDDKDKMPVLIEEHLSQ